MSSFSLDFGIIYPKCRKSRLANLILGEIMPNRYQETKKNTSDPPILMPTGNFQNQTWSGSQVQMYNVQDFNHQQPNLTPNQPNWGPSTASRVPTTDTAQLQQQQQQHQPEGWDWSTSSTQHDPWAWGGVNPPVSTMQNNTSDTSNHAGVVMNAETIEDQSANWSDPSWNNTNWPVDNYYPWYPPQNNTEPPIKEQHQQQDYGLKSNQPLMEAKEVVNPVLSGHAPHLFQRSDSWLSGSSLLTINDSLSTSQDTLDATHFIPPDTLEVVRQHMADMALQDGGDKGDCGRGGEEGDRSGGSNQEVPVEENNTNDVGDCKNNNEDEQIRQPPEGAATKNPVAPTQLPLIPPNPPINTRIPTNGGGGVSTTSNTFSSTPEQRIGTSNHNAESIPDSPENNSNLTPLNPVNPSLNNITSVDGSVHHLNIYASLIGPRDGSPFKPPTKSAASIAPVIQQEVTAKDGENSSISSCRRRDDESANLEMTPDNSEQPPTDVETKNIKPTTTDTPPIPASASLWNEPAMIEAKVFLAPAASIQQNALIIPQLTDQQQQQQLPTIPHHVESVHLATENVEDLSHATDSTPKPQQLDSKVPVKEDKTVDNTVPTRGQRPPVPGLGPVQPPRATSDPPKRNDVIVDQSRRASNESNRLTRSFHEEQMRQDRPESRQKYPEQPDLRQDHPERQDLNRDYPERQDLNRDYPERQDLRQDYPERKDLHQDYPDSRQRYADYPERPNSRQERRSYRDGSDYHHHHHPDRPDSRSGRDYRDYYPDDRRRGHVGEDDRSRYYDDPYYGSLERDRSRPSSRPSMDERDYAGSGRPRGEERPSSRSGYESDRDNGYYRRNSHDYSRDEYYRRDPRNYRDAQYSRYDQERYYRQYYNYYRYGYNSHDYGYIDELYRTDPQFRAQYDAQYRAYVASAQHYAGYDSSDQRSVQSGRSSVNDEIQREKYSAEYVDGSLESSHDYMSRSTEGARLTPAKFPLPHIKVQLNSQGSLVKLLANNPADGQPGIVEIHDIQSLLTCDPDLDELKRFPGPLIRGDTHKNDVIQFCTEKVKFAQTDVHLSDKDSYILIWELLILLIRQNGIVVGADIAELLLKDHESKLNHGDGGDELTTDGAANTEVVMSEGNVATLDRSVINRSSEETVTKKFRECLLSGRKKEALEKAMKHGLWGHALFLASKMDKRTYASVMTRFANSLTLNDPLQTLYQLMSGRQPASVTCVAEEKWGDWRPHLAMILSNPTERPDLDRKSIITMGDTLATRGLLHASHFCYLMAQMDFGNYTTKTSKLVLLSSNHSLPFNQFATNEAIQCTEIYQYAQQLANPDFLIQSFQTYRFIYATRLMSIGLSQDALHYLEVLAEAVCKVPAFFNQEMVAQICELGNKLKYLDHFYTNPDIVPESCDPEWLVKLKNILPVYNSDMIQHLADDTVYSESSAGSEISDGISHNNLNQIQPAANHYDPNSMVPTMDMSQNFTGQIGYQQFSPQIVPESGTTNHFSYPSDGINAYQQDYQQQQPTGTTDIYQGSYYQPEANSSTTTTNNNNLINYTNAQNNVSGHVEDYWDEATKKVSPPHSPLKSDISNTIHNRTTISGTRKQEKKEVKSKPPAVGGGTSWLGGIFSKLMPKPKNQMKLPDDRNPTIVWDDVSKRWVNTEDDDDETTTGPSSPPNDTEILGRRQSIPKLPSMSTTSIDHAPPPGGNEFNKFRRQGTQKRYVDVVDPGTRFKPQVAPMTTNFYPDTTPSNQQQTPQLFIPTNHDANQSDYNPYSIPPQVGNPGSRPGSPVNNLEHDASELSRSSSQGSLGREVQHYMVPNTIQTQQPALMSQPMMFDPSQFANKNPSTSTTTTTSRNRYPR